MARTFKIQQSALKHKISEEQIEQVLANTPQKTARTTPETAEKL